MNQRQYSFAELTRKSVINVADGKELGKACDLIFSSCGNVCGIVVPGKKSIIKSITSADTIYIPWNRIMKIGADAVLVELVGNYASTMSDADTQNQEQNKDISYWKKHGINRFFSISFRRFYICLSDILPTAFYAHTTFVKTINLIINIL